MTNLVVYAALTAIEYVLPDNVVGNEELAQRAPQWTAVKLLDKTGIAERRVVSDDECASDLAVAAAEKLFASGACSREEIDYVLYCTQSPDYPLPTTACLIQERLKLRTSVGALDFNLGCSGYVYGLGLAQGLIESGQARQILLLTGETYSKFLHEDDVATRCLFGDAGTATLVSGIDHPAPLIGPYVYGTDGRGAPHLILKRNAIRRSSDVLPQQPAKAAHWNGDFLWMNGPEIFVFASERVPALVNETLNKAGMTLDEIDLFVFHQANVYMLDHLRAKLAIPRDRFWIAMRDCGNTVSSTIPIALYEAISQGKLVPGMTTLLVGFGVGYSWGGVIVRWPIR